MPDAVRSIHAPSSQQQAVLRAVLESPQEIVIFALDRGYRYLAFNENHARTIRNIWGAEARVGMCMLDIVLREDDREKARQNFDRALAGESFVLHEEYGDERINRIVFEDVYSPIRDERGEVIGLTVYLTDITKRLQAERELALYRDQLEELVRQRTEELTAAHAQLLHVQKLEGLGVLAGGVAHDFNNLLAVILGRTELARAGLANEHPVKAHLDVVHDTALEARQLTRQLLNYAGKGKFLVQVASLNELVEGAMQLLRASVSKQITITLELARDEPVVEVDLTQFRQVLLNLVVNAAEAIGERSGQITLRTSRADVDEALLRRMESVTLVADGSYGCLEVVDTGSGIDPDVKNKLFDPFFTTKFAGRGLGLAAVLGIVRSHRGTIGVTSELGVGSSFRVYFPTSKSAQTVPASPPERASASAPHAGVVLVVDDEQAVRQVTEIQLRALGYRVLAASSGKQAIELVRQHGAEIRTVLLDLTMPEMNGTETLRTLRELRPELDVILMTGYAADDVADEAPNVRACLSKPFSRAELIAVLAACPPLASGQG